MVLIASWSRVWAQLATVAVVVLALLSSPAWVAADTTIELFTRPGCPHCAEADRFLTELRRERDDFTVTELDVMADPDALARLHELSARAGVQTPGVPTFVIGQQVLVGFDPRTTPERIRSLLSAPMPPVGPANGPPGDAVALPLVGRVSVERLGLPLFTVLVGLLDGFNPCAMWVLLFLLAMLVNLKNRSRMALIAGTFVVVSGMVYFAFMAAWLTMFMVVGVSQPLRLLLAVIALLIGIVHLKDFVAFGRGPSLSIPESAKPGIYKRTRKILQAESLTGAMAGIIVLAALVNLVELLCTAGLPALYTAILTSQELPSWKYYTYLALYIAAYVADDAVMVTIAVVTLGKRKLQERGGRWLKLLSGLVIMALGLMLLLRPRWVGF